MPEAKPLKITMSWSGGKDCAFALWQLMQNKDFEVVSLHTTFGEETRRVGLHGIHDSLIEAQAKMIGLPLDKIYFPASGNNTAYEKAMEAFFDKLESDGITHMAFGDIFLEDLKAYREEQLNSRNFKGVFPLWKEDTAILAQKFIDAGFKTLICAADADKIPKQWVGKTFDNPYLEALPAEVDPCGENGEFHSFCIAGPIFLDPIAVSVGEPTVKSYTFKMEDGTESKKEFYFAPLELV